MTALTCEQARTLVTEIRPGDVASDTAVAIADHLIDCDDCRTAMLSCQQALSLFESVRTGSLTPGPAVRLTTHLVECDGCRTQADTARRLQALLEGVEIPDTLSQRLAVATQEHLAHQLRARAVETVLGWAALAYSDNGLVLVHRYERTPADAIQPLRERLGDIVIQDVRRDDIGDSASRKLVAYHEGARVQFDEPVDLSLVSPFTRQVLHATARIPYGEVRPYAWVAREIGRPRAARAVGGSLHINPAAPIIPCHRVIASDNTLGGYGGGLEMKKWLLRLEGYLK
jgi:methylated-DNA-[protein]-cysteine S-methyltransferase